MKYKIYTDIKNRRFLCSSETTFLLKNKTVVIDDLGDFLLIPSNNSFKKISIEDLLKTEAIIDIGQCTFLEDENILKTEKNEIIKLKFDETPVNRIMFTQGYCVEFAIVLKKELEKKYPKKSFSFASIRGKFLDEDYSTEEEVEYYYEDCHGCVIDNSNKEYYFDVNGINRFDNHYNSFVFSDKPIDVELFIFEDIYEEEFKELFGEFEDSAIEKAKLYLRQNKELLSSFYNKDDKNIKSKATLNI